MDFQYIRHYTNKYVILSIHQYQPIYELKHIKHIPQNLYTEIFVKKLDNTLHITTYQYRITGNLKTFQYRDQQSVIYNINYFDNNISRIYNKVSNILYNIGFYDNGHCSDKGIEKNNQILYKLIWNNNNIKCTINQID